MAASACFFTDIPDNFLSSLHKYWIELLDNWWMMEIDSSRSRVLHVVHILAFYNFPIGQGLQETYSSEKCYNIYGRLRPP